MNKTPESLMGQQRSADGHEMRERSVSCLGTHGFHRMAYTEWGDPDNPDVLLCVHGLTRNGRDFDKLARAMSDRYRVICPDVVGRGRSDWLRDKSAYGFPTYMADMAALVARLDVETVHWVGTSMGGLIGMFLASQPGTPITRMVLNDVGPVVTAVSLQRIGPYVGTAPIFPSLKAAETYIREVSAPFGPLTDEDWQHLTTHAVRQGDDGFSMVYDPAIGETFRAAPMEEDVDLWAVYEAIKCPTLVIRGAESDLLMRDTLLEMAQRGPKAEVVEIAGVGHAPMLLDASQIDVVRRFLLG